MTTPSHTDSAPQSIGDYTAGCVSGAATLPIDGPGYQAMRLSRQRLYGHPDLISFIERLAQLSHTTIGKTLLIGDLGQPRGGPTLSGHRSHQTGLDVDIWFLMRKDIENRTLSHQERETLNAPLMVSAKTGRIDLGKWTDEHAQVLELASEMPEVDRIFVNAGIKKHLCESQKNAAWLRKIRPWWGHDEHFHVRLKCPENNPFCVRQPPVPIGDGCDASLDWWFTAEARTPQKKPGQAVVPTLPDQCATVLYQ